MGNRYPGNLAARATLGTIDCHGWLPSLIEQTALLSPPVDPELAGVYLAKYGADPRFTGTCRRYRAMGASPSAMQFHHSYNISSAAIHRRKDWIVVIDGARKHHRGIEMYCRPGSPLSFMRNSCFGSIQVLTRKPEVDLWNGWDFNHFPGVTARV